MARYQNVMPDPSQASEKSGYGQTLTEQDLIKALVDSSDAKQEYL